MNTDFTMSIYRKCANQSTKIDDSRDQTLSVLAFAHAKYSWNTNVKNGCVLL